MKSLETNYPAVIVAAVLHFLLGAVWFWALMSPWLVGIGKSHDDLAREGSPVLAYVAAFGCDLILAWALSWLIRATGRTNVAGGMMIGAFLWFGLVATTTATEYVFEARSFRIFAINAGYPLAGMLIMGGLLGAWKKSQPAHESS